MLSQADAGPREYRRRGRTVNATHLHPPHPEEPKRSECVSKDEAATIGASWFETRLRRSSP